MSDRKHGVQEAGPKNIFKMDLASDYGPLLSLGTDLSINNGVLQVDNASQYEGVYYFANTIGGHTYRISFDFYQGAQVQAVTFDPSYSQGNNIVLSNSGSYSYTYTLTGDLSQIYWRNVLPFTTSFKLDNIRIEDLSVTGISAQTRSVTSTGFEGSGIQNASTVRSHSGSASVALYTPTAGTSAPTTSSDRISINVYPGDYVDVEVYGYYTTNTGPNSQGILMLELQDATGVITPAVQPLRPNSQLVTSSSQINAWNKITYHYQVPQNLTHTGQMQLIAYCWNSSNQLNWFDDLKLTQTTPGMGTVVYVPDVESSTDYYSFGQPLIGRKFFSDKYRYGFNGKENDRETISTGSGTQDYGLRIYNPSLGKFLSVDPLAASFPWYTPYQFAGNKPIWAIDLDGAEEWVNTQTTFGDPALASGPLSDDYANRNGWMPKNNGTNEYVENVQVPSFVKEPNELHQYIANVGIANFAPQKPNLPEEADQWQKDFEQWNYENSMKEWNSLSEEKKWKRAYANYVRGEFHLAWKKAYAEPLVELYTIQAQLGGSGLATGPALFRSGLKTGILDVTKEVFTVNPTKFDYFFGRVVSGSTHNVTRSAQNLKALTALGVTTERQLMDIFSQALESGTVVSTKANNFGTTVTKSISIGSQGSIHVGFFYPGGNMNAVPSVTTIIPKIFK